MERDSNDRQKFSEASKVVKMPEAFGTEDHEADARNWRDFLLNFKSWLFYADKSFEPGLSNVESNPKNVVSLAAMNEDSKSKALQLYAILTGLLKGKPLRLLRQQDAWRYIGNLFRCLHPKARPELYLFCKHLCSFRSSRRTRLLVNRFWVWKDCVVNIHDVQGKIYPSVSWFVAFLLS